MTMAMIGLIMFALVMISATNTNFAAIFLNDDTKGGFDVVVYTNPNNPITDIEAAAEQAGVDTSVIEGTGEVRVAFSFESQVSNIQGKGDVDPDTGEPPEYLRSSVLGVDQGWLDTNAVPLRVRAEGFENDEAVWRELTTNPNAVVLAAFHTVAPDPFAGTPEDGFWVDRFGDEFEPFEIEVRGTAGVSRTLTVIGQMNDAGSIFFAGMVVQKDTLLAIFPNSQEQQFYIALEEGTDSREFAQALEAGLLTASVDSLDKILDDQQSLQNGFLLVFQGFMGLGLIVGIAALGVVASRSVVERRQQIGMLRAIGYQRSMVALSFIFESSFIALSGILMGLVLGLSLAWVLFTTGDIGEEAEGATFIVPWVQITVIAAIAFIESMLMTFLPARAASRVAVAEALRYE
jgi:putative ABC transport system permease protein